MYSLFSWCTLYPHSVFAIQLILYFYGICLPLLFRNPHRHYRCRLSAMKTTLSSLLKTSEETKRFSFCGQNAQRERQATPYRQTTKTNGPVTTGSTASVLGQWFKLTRNNGIQRTTCHPNWGERGRDESRLLGCYSFFGKR